MRMRWAVAGLAVAMSVVVPVFAEPKGRGRVASQSPEEHTKKAAGRVANEAVDAVADELAGTQSRTSTGMPPGLAKKGKMPPGLAKQGKTPPGWEKGKKAGWDGKPQQESLIRASQ